MLLQRLPRLGCRGASPLALLSASLGTGAKPQLPAAATASSAEACPSVETARGVQHAAGSCGARRSLRAQAPAAAAAEMCSGIAARRQLTLQATTMAAAKECRTLSTSSRQLLTAAAGIPSTSSHPATALSAQGPQPSNRRSSSIAGTSTANVPVRGYAAVAPPPRDPRFATLEEADLDAFRGMLGAGNVLTDASALQAVNK